MTVPLYNNSLEIMKQLYYKDKKSMQDIANVLGKSLNFVKYHMEKANLPRRSRSEATYIKLNAVDPFKIKKQLNRKEEKLKIAGLMLYWAEGRKKTGRIDISNSDPNIILLFLRFLREICVVDEKRLAVSLQMFDDQDQAQLMNFWSNLTKVPLKQFHKPYKREGKKGSYTFRSQYGTVLVGLDNVKLKKIILAWLEQYKHYFYLNADVAQW